MIVLHINDRKVKISEPQALELLEKMSKINFFSKLLDEYPKTKNKVVSRGMSNYSGLAISTGFYV